MPKLSQQRILGIESTSYSVSIGVMDNGVAIGSFFLNDGMPGSKTLLKTLDNLLVSLQIKPETLDGICVSKGPGSFTSLRISLATAESLGLGLNIPVYGVDSLILIAATVPFYPDAIRVIQNAYKGEYYSATYQTNRGFAEEIEPLQLIEPEALYETLISGDLILGDAAREFAGRFDLAAKNVRWNSDFHRIPSGVSVIEQFLNTEVRPPSDIPLEPIYIRPSEAEINYSIQFKDR